MTARRVVFIGAAGEMRKIDIERFAKADGDLHLVLCDIRPELVHPLAKRLPDGRTTVRQLDLYNPPRFARSSTAPHSSNWTREPTSAAPSR
ncbi:hypothetical protein [Streptomyces sp. NPDC005828]|uniref:hypothetical protein n=1 Tax=Streptomyces sp. NPDC005828 TaxID=3157071 RepID=UPI0033D20182